MAEKANIEKRLIARRGQIKAELTRFQTFLDKYSTGKYTLTEIETRYEATKDILTEFKIKQVELEDVMLEIGTLNQEQASAEREDFQKKYFKAISTAKDLMSRLSTPVNSPTPVVNSVAVTQLQPNTKLQAIKIPDFSGQYSEWQRFRDTFTALVDNNSALQNIEKFYHLQSCLKGEAAQVIASLPLSDANYVTAINLLTERFDNKKAIINAHFKEIFDLPALHKESHVTLRNFLDTCLKNLRALESLGEPVEGSSTILIYLLNTKLDFSTKREWENFSKDISKPKLDDFSKFLTQRCQVLEALDKKSTGNSGYRQKQSFQTFEQSGTVCPSCNDKHFIYVCPKFKALPVSSRFEEVKRLSLCTNCLRKGHRNSDCRSSGCRICNGRHSTLLHQPGTSTPKGFGTPNNYNSKTRPQTNVNISQTRPSTSHDNTLDDTQNVSHLNETQNCTMLSRYTPKYSEPFVLLSTALVHVFDKNHIPLSCRVLLDSGSQSNFITRDMVTRLNLTTRKVNIPVSGINQIKTTINEQVRVTISSIHVSYKSEVTCLVIDKISDFTPQASFDISNLKLPDLPLADPDFNVASCIDMLIGSSLFYNLLVEGQIQLGKGLPVLQNSILGWVVAGNIPINQRSSKCFFLNTNSNDNDFNLNSQIERFWKIEEVSQIPEKSWTSEERECEQHFVNTCSRNEQGRFVLKLPLKCNFLNLGDSENRALNRLYSMEQRLSKNENLKIQYNNFMHEYEILDHMRQISRDQKSLTPIYYLPHHSVIKIDSVTTKLRVVFDASAKTSSNLSLNDVLMDGPTLQNDLFSILLRFRKHKVVFVGDLTKMYRQILIHPEHQNLQRILWRDNPQDEVKYYNLQTLTYGEKPASFLATRCLKQIAIENIDKYPTECDIINKDMYMDDVLTGAPDSATLSKIRENLSYLLSNYGFEIRKYQSNDTNFLNEISSTSETQYMITDDSATKTLGVCWIPSLDVFRYKGQYFHFNPDKATKRTILSFIAKIFDPLSLLGPILIRSKLLMQKLWQLQLEWDEPISADLYTQWLNFQADLSDIQSLQIPRVILVTKPRNIQIHAFSDSSEKSYGCTIYIRSMDEQGHIQCHLLCAKSRVAPLKSISLPRLELCGALLMSRLLSKCLSILDLPINDTFLWTDSTIVLSWIAGEPRMWKTFVSNRVSEIQSLTTVKNWNYIASPLNPADIISRGCTLHDLKHSILWWHGPDFLQKSEESWPTDCNIVNFARSSDKTPEFKPETVTFLNINDKVLDIFQKYSNYNKLIRVFGYCLRFINNVKLNKGNRVCSSSLSPSEINNSIESLSKIVQSTAFSSDLRSLQESGSVNPKSNLRSLSPFLQNGLIRVGGRLENAHISYNSKHPIILPQSHPFSRLIIEHEHARSLHAGAQTTLSFIRQTFWPLNGKNSVKKCIRNCITCFKAKPEVLTAKMGQLPAPRVIPTSPFLTSSVDLAGPYALKDGKLKNRKIIKSYICVFVCMSTKAAHLELISDLTSDGFLNVLKRFVSRRGLCTHLYCDNATNFVGANNELLAIQKLTNDNVVRSYLNNNQIKFHFIPPRSPNFGGLWEAAVKSTKHHLKRVLNQRHLTYEEFYSILTQVEAVLNSRPITPLSNDPLDLEALTPGHFLIGRVLTAIPQRNLIDVKSNYIRRYHLTQQIVQHFWSRWTKEYLHLLQQRIKWQSGNSPLDVGTMVLVKEENLPPLCWPLGRIVEIHPGSDSIVRVVSVLTKSGIFKRAISKICALPINVEV